MRNSASIDARSINTIRFLAVDWEMATAVAGYRVDIPHLGDDAEAGPRDIVEELG